MNWRALAMRLDRIAVHTFDETGCSLQPMASGAAVGAAIPVPADFDPVHVDQEIGNGGETLGIQRIVADIHIGDLPIGTVLQPDDSLLLPDSRTIGQNTQFIVGGTSPNAGTYVVDTIEPNPDKTGLRLRLKRS